MKRWDVKVRVLPEVRYMTPPKSMREAVLRRQTQFRIQVMAAKLEAQVEQMLAEQINAEIDLAEAENARIRATVRVDGAQ